jgi:hypothetical protein
MFVLPSVAAWPALAIPPEALQNPKKVYNFYVPFTVHCNKIIQHKTKKMHLFKLIFHFYDVFYMFLTRGFIFR